MGVVPENVSPGEVQVGVGRGRARAREETTG